MQAFTGTCVAAPGPGRPEPGLNVRRDKNRTPAREGRRKKMGVGRHVNDSEPDDGSYFDGGMIEDYEDSTRATRPSEHGETVFGHDDIEDAVDLIIVRFRRRKVPFRVIGRILNRSKACIVERYHRLPADQRRFYERAGLWGMD